MELMTSIPPFFPLVTHVIRNLDDSQLVKNQNEIGDRSRSEISNHKSKLDSNPSPEGLVSGRSLQRFRNGSQPVPCCRSAL